MIDFDTSGLKPLERLQLLGMSPDEKRKLLIRIGRIVGKGSKQRIKDQTDLDGKPFTPRKDLRDEKKSRKKMLKGWIKKIKHKVNDDDSVTIFVAGRSSAKARQHQEGFKQRISKKNLKRANPQSQLAPATRSQAKALKQQGFRWPWRENKGKSGRPKKGKKRTIKWIVENLTIGQAGAILRDMRGKSGKQSWEIVVPARSFLGADGSEKSRIILELKEAVFKTEAIYF